MISCFHSILIFHMCVLQGSGRHYSVAFCEALSVIVECGGKICREVYQQGRGRRVGRRSDGGKWSKQVKESEGETKRGKLDRWRENVHVKMGREGEMHREKWQRLGGQLFSKHCLLMKAIVKISIHIEMSAKSPSSTKLHLAANIWYGVWQTVWLLCRVSAG